MEVASSLWRGTLAAADAEDTMHRARDGVVESTPVTPAEARRAAARRPARLPYVVRADLEAGTVSVLWPAGAGRNPPRPGGRGGEGRSP